MRCVGAVCWYGVLVLWCVVVCWCGGLGVLVLWYVGEVCWCGMLVWCVSVCVCVCMLVLWCVGVVDLVGGTLWVDLVGRRRKRRNNPVRAQHSCV